MSFATRAHEAVRAVAMSTLADTEATPHDVARAKSALASKPADLRKLTDAELAIWIYLREKLAGRETERHELAARAQDFADALAAPALPGCRRCRQFSDEDIGDLRAVTPLMLPPGDPDHEHE